MAGAAGSLRNDARGRAGSTSAGSANAARARFLRSRAASVLAICPLGLWTVVHIWHNLAAFDGAQPWQSAVTEYPHPFAQAVVFVIVLWPLALHVLWGIGRLATSRPNNARYRYYANLKYLLQRITAIGVLLFLGAHIWLACVRPRLVEGHAEAFADIAHEMRHHGPTLVTYLLGTLGVAYHLSDGVQTFCLGWGVVSSARALRRLEGAAIALFLLLLVMAWAAIYALWQAGGGD